MTKYARRFISPVIKRSIVINGHKTSVALENKFWSALKHIAESQEKTLFGLVGDIDVARTAVRQANLSSACRLFVVDWALEHAGLSEIMMEVA